MNLLFLNVGRRCELVDAFRRALRHHGGGVVYGSDINPNAPALHKVDKGFLFPRSDSPEFSEVLAAFCLEHRIDLLIPTIDPDLAALAGIRPFLKNACPALRMLLSPDWTIKLARDKRLSTRHFAELGAEVPCPVAPESAEFPVFVKPPDGSASKGAGIVSDRATLDARLKEQQELMIEQIVTGPELTVDVLCDFEADPLFAAVRRRIQIRGGEVSQGVLESHPQLETMATGLAKGFRCTGPVTLQFRSPGPGRYVAMELNARMGGGLPLTIAGGANWPSWILDLCQGKRPDTNVKLRYGLVMARHDSSVFIDNHALTRIKRPGATAPHPGLYLLLRGVKAFVFDLDDTLYPEHDYHFAGYRAVAERVLQQHGIDIEHALRRAFADGLRGDLFSAVLGAQGVEVDEPAILELVKVYDEQPTPLSPYLDTAVIPQLKAAGCRIGLISNGRLRLQQNKLRILGISTWFDAVVFPDDLGRAAWKPAVDGYRECLKQLMVGPEEAVYIGDRPAMDFPGAKALGMKTLRIRRSGADSEAIEPCSPEQTADREIRSLFELRTVLTKGDTDGLAR